MQSLGERLKQLRNGDSQTVFAKKIGVSQVAYSRYEQNQREPDLEMLCRIGVMFGVSTDWLLGLSSDRNGGGDYTKAKDCSDCKYKKAVEAITAAIGELPINSST